MRKLLGAAVAALTLGVLAPVASHALSAPSRAAHVDAELASALRTAPKDRDLLVFVHGVTRADALAAIRSAGATKVGEFQSIAVPIAVGTPAQVQALITAPGVTYVEPNRAVHLLDDTSYRAIRADEAKALPFAGGPFDGRGQTVAIVDGGVDGTHPMFMKDGKSKVVRNLKVACLNNTPVFLTDTPAGTGQFPPDTCPRGAAADPLLIDMTATNDTDTISAGGHGTHVAGIAAGYRVKTSDGRTFSGAAPGAKLVSISTGASLGIYGANAGLDWIVRHHADPCGNKSCPPITVVNNSYGSSGNDQAWNKHTVTSELQAALIKAGVVVVWANGNGDTLNNGGDGSDNRSGSDAQDPLPGVISVANYDDGGTGTRDGALDSSSSRGAKGHPETWPDLSAPGTNITSACRPYLTICTSGEPDPNYGTISGTSMASPHVAGAVAVLRQAVPTLTPEQVELALQNSAHRFSFGGAYQRDPQDPATPSSFDKGHGLIDLADAIRLVKGQALAASAVTKTDVGGVPPAPDGTSAQSGGDETIRVPNAVPGVYRVVVKAYATVESTYRGSVKVS